MTSTREFTRTPSSGWPVLVALFVGIGLSIALFTTQSPPLAIVGALILMGCFVSIGGFFVVEPNMSRVLTLFGKYTGSVREDGFFFVNPFTHKRKVSLRAHNLDGNVLKVNDLLGNPIEISAVVVWRVRETARAVFDVEDYEHYVQVQSEAAVRQMALSHPYDDGMHAEAVTTLRGSTEEVTAELQEGLQERLDEAGIEVVEARINHLAYASEIASAMLQRQQAGAIIAARAKIVEGAVGMVEDALGQLDRDGLVKLDDEKRAQLVGNLLVVLCGQAHPQPVVQTGSL
ncbi:MAG: SPFH domain-containing protein [Planctomycetota bacterium]